MSFKYINDLATPENTNKFLELVDITAGVGKDVHNVFELADRFRTGRQMELCTQAIKRDPASAKMLEEKYVGPPYDLEAMLKMPKGSLGWTYAKVISTLGFEPQFYLALPSSFETDGEYINFRVAKTHDIHHILTGYSMNNLGEFGVISVSIGQFRHPAFLFIDLVGLLTSFFTSDKLYDEQNMEPSELQKTLAHRFRLMSDGIEMGRVAKPLFPVKWEEGFERPIDEWRQELNIKPVTEGFYSWYSNPKLRAALET